MRPAAGGPSFGIGIGGSSPWWTNRQERPGVGRGPAEVPDASAGLAHPWVLGRIGTCFVFDTGIGRADPGAQQASVGGTTGDRRTEHG